MGIYLTSTRLEIPDREKRGIERKGNFIIDLRCYKLFHCTVGPMDRLSCVLSMALPSFILSEFTRAIIKNAIILIVPVLKINAKDIIQRK